MIYGNLPRDLGLIDLSPTEMMFWLYCPISVPGDHTMHIPDNLLQFMPIIREVRYDDMERWAECYVYITAKTLWVSGDYIGNRPGWHSDGFGTDDLNYIWYDREPTEFVETSVKLSTDCDESMRQMEAIGMNHQIADAVVTYPDKHLLRLDPSVIHRSPGTFKPGMRTFVKVSISKDRYDLVGNSVNHLLGDLGPMQPRRERRNHPASVTALGG